MFSIQYSFKERLVTIFKQIHNFILFRHNLPALCFHKHLLNTINICTMRIATPSWCSIQYPRKNNSMKNSLQLSKCESLFFLVAIINRDAGCKYATHIQHVFNCLNPIAATHIVALHIALFQSPALQ